MKSLILLALAPAALFALTAPVAAQDRIDASGPTADQSAIAQEQVLSSQAASVFFLMRGDENVAVADVFSSQFLTTVSATQLNGILDQLQEHYGPVVSVYSVERTGTYRARVSFRLERAIVSGDMVLNPAEPHQIEGLLLNDIDLIGDRIGAIQEELEALPGEVGVYFGSLDGTRPQLAINADKQFAIGSTFKLYVLSALAAEMEADNERYWDDVTFVGAICLDARCPKEGRSFPSGITQDWPAPMPMTIQTLATLMISQSDNTATDALIEYLGEERIVQEVIASGHSQPALNQPFLTTRQMFALKASDDAVIASYRQGDLDTKYDLAWAAAEREIAQDDVNAAFATGPRAIDIEWFASANDLRRLLAHLPQDKHDIARQILAINPAVGPNASANYGPIYYKGGSEPGVLNFTWLVRSVYGWEVLTMSWNNPDAVLDEARFQSLAQRLLALPPQTYLNQTEISVPLATEAQRP